MRPEYKRSKVGFPIRKSSDQSSFAAPQGLSQRTTSFIASQRQGIHRMLLRHLITLMIDARPRQRRTRPKRKTSPADFSTRLLLAKYTRPNSLRGRRAERLRSTSRMYSLFTISNIRVPLSLKKQTRTSMTPDKNNKPPTSNEGKTLKKEVVEPDGIEPTTS